MAVQMAMVGDAGASGQGGCDGCGGSGDDGVGSLTCSSMLNCAGMAALLPVEGGLGMTHAAEVFVPVCSVARDLTAPPDPYPPRSVNLG